MAFTGTPVVTLVSDGLVRIHIGSGEEDAFSLAEGASGTITLAEATVAGDVSLPAAFKPRTYVNGTGDSVALQDSIQVELTYVDAGITTQPIRVVKTGTTPLNFLITLTNDSTAELASQGLEIYVRFH